jgi:hypothetical protein
MAVNGNGHEEIHEPAKSRKSKPGTEAETSNERF